MKCKILLLFVLISWSAFSQAPALINYQGMLRNSVGVPLANRTVGLRFDIRQGAPGGSVVFSETQNGVNTGPLGLINTQIGKVNAGALGLINWNTGPYFLQVHVDTSSTGNFTESGSQQILSTPYSLFAKSVPSSYKNNILTIGDSSYVINSSSTVSITSGNSNISVSGTYPALVISSTPTLELNNNELSISNGNTVIVAPALNVKGYTLSVGPSTNSVVLPSAGAPNITGTGIASVSVFSGTNFTLDVPTPTLTGTGATTVNGQYPSFTINTPTPDLQGAGATTVTGNFPNYTINTSSTSIVGTGASTVTGNFPNYTVNTPSPNILGTGATTVTGNYPNYTINTPSPNLQGVGATTVTGNYPNYSINTPSPNLQGVGATTVTGNYPNYSINTPSPNLQGVGATTVTGNYPNYSINTPSPNLQGVGATTVTGNYPNYSINTPSPNLQGVGATTVTGNYPNYSINTPSPNLQGVGATTVTGNYPNYTVNTPSPNLQGAGATTVTGNFPNYTVNTPSPNIVGTGISTVTGNYPNYSIATPSPIIQGQGATSVTGNYPNYTVTTTVPTVTATGLAQTSVSGNTLTIHVPTFSYAPATGVLSSGTNTVLAVPTLTLVNNVLRSGPSSNTVMITESPWTRTANTVYLSDTMVTDVGIGTFSPGINAGSSRYLTISATHTYTTRTAALELQGGSLNTGIPFGKLDFNSVGHGSSSNSVRISAYRSGNVTEGKLGFSTSDGTTLQERILINELGHVGMGTSSPVRNLQVQTTAHTSVAIVAASGSISNLSFGNPSNHFLGNIRYDNTLNLMSFWTNNVPDRFVIAGNGNVGIGTNAPATKFHTEVSNGRFQVTNFTPAANTILLGQFIGNNALGPQLRFAMTGGGPQVDIGQNTNGDFVIESNDSPKLVVENTGNVGIGTSAPTATLDVLGTVKIVDGSQGSGKVFVSDASGKGRWEASPAPVVYTNMHQGFTSVASTPTPLVIGTITYNKVHANTKLDIYVYSRAYSGNSNILFPFSWTRFEIYVDGNTSPYSTEHIITSPNTTEYITLKSIFTGLSTGSHTITIRANTDGNTATNVLMDPGGYAGKMIVQEQF
jgi:hypothetical protein